MNHFGRFFLILTLIFLAAPLLRAADKSFVAQLNYNRKEASRIAAAFDLPLPHAKIADKKESRAQALTQSQKDLAFFDNEITTVCARKKDLTEKLITVAAAKDIGAAEAFAKEIQSLEKRHVGLKALQSFLKSESELLGQLMINENAQDRAFMAEMNISMDKVIKLKDNDDLAKYKVTIDEADKIRDLAFVAQKDRIIKTEIKPEAPKDQPTQPRVPADDVPSPESK